MHSTPTIDEESGFKLKPEIVTFDNLTKGGVDMVNQMCGTYSVRPSNQQMASMPIFRPTKCFAVDFSSGARAAAPNAAVTPDAVALLKISVLLFIGKWVPLPPDAISINQASFSWSEDIEATPALKNLTLSIPKRSLVGVIGRVGSGKSTLL
ncbi:hypothetical protein LAZ67_18000584 [Cordylochernes scorpioides]|uniref:ABC transporter domain-containing protein n=1 Tax=Cordylochernes scorpioides TaxID=51811 RepID=A0ABY6LFX7_9ARAC|nr:hypothetical protein LAZ67_18000584 [Cordylochernes scorpioides]